MSDIYDVLRRLKVGEGTTDDGFVKVDADDLYRLVAAFEDLDDWRDEFSTLQAALDRYRTYEYADGLVDVVMSCMGTDYKAFSPTFRAGLQTQMATYVHNVLNGREAEYDESDVGVEYCGWKECPGRSPATPKAQRAASAGAELHDVCDAQRRINAQNHAWLKGLLR